MDDNNLFKFDLPNHNNNKTKSYNYLNNYKNQEQNDKLNQNVKLIPHNNINNNFINYNHFNNIKNNVTKKENIQIKMNEPFISFVQNNLSKDEKMKNLEKENSTLKRKIVDLNKKIIQLNKKIDLYENILNSNNLSTNIIINKNKELIKKNENSILQSLNKNQTIMNMGIHDNNKFNNGNNFYIQNNNNSFINNYNNPLNQNYFNHNINFYNPPNNNNNNNLNNLLEISLQNKTSLNPFETNQEHKYNIDNSFDLNNSIENDIDVDNMTYEELLELENKIGYVKKGVSIEQKLSLKIEKYSQNKFDCKECVICKELLKENEFIRILNCSHIFHINCIDEWFKDNKICPICKKDVE